jgi:hypothetical protein
MIRRALTGLALLLLIVACSALPASAQQLRGSVVDSATSNPIAGAVLVLLDSDGRTLGRNITNEHGVYHITLVPAMKRMRVLRLGYRPRLVSIPALSMGTATLDVVMSSIPTLLEPITVVDQPNCPERADRSAAFALWEQAKSALLASVVARESNPPSVVRLHFERHFDRSFDKIEAQRVMIDSAATARPFVASRSASAFVEVGFVQDRGGTMYFYGPDADVMLDDAFVRRYCFQLADAEQKRPHEIGLAFAAADRKRGRVDIEGALWIDSVSRTLTDIVFRYVGVDPPMSRYQPEGRVSFRAIDNGSVLVDRWYVRYMTGVRASRGSRVTELDERYLQAREAGGQVAFARWPDGREWRGSLATARGRIVGHVGAGSVVRLLGTDYETIADSSGAFQFSNLLPGPYAVGAADSRLAEIGILPKAAARFIAVLDSTVTFDVVASTTNQYVTSKCQADAEQLSTAMLVARVVLPNGSPAGGARVEVRAEADGRTRLAEGEADENGMFHLCRAPRNVPLVIRADYAGADPAVSIKSVDETVSVVKLLLQARRK